MRENVTLGEAAIILLRESFDVFFGIPGVHTIELYRGLARQHDWPRHVTPRHEQSAAFMADGYCRATGRVAACCLITGPGVTNAITAIGQARADGVPMFVLSSVNPIATHRKETGHLHELPDQRALMANVAKFSETVMDPDDLARILTSALQAMFIGRPGPVHVEIPTDLLQVLVAKPNPLSLPNEVATEVPNHVLQSLAERLDNAQFPLILAGGGAVDAATFIRSLAERLDAPVMTTVNARGIMANHPLSLPLSPSTDAGRAVLAEADHVLAIATQWGPTDFDMYGVGAVPKPKVLTRVDLDPKQTRQGIAADFSIVGDASTIADALAERVKDCVQQKNGAARAASAMQAAMSTRTTLDQRAAHIFDVIAQVCPKATIVGDSTQPIYSGNLTQDGTRPRGWFNAATGFGALGFGAPAAIGAGLGRVIECTAKGKDVSEAERVVCVTGDGGLQFSLAELGTAVDENIPVIFVVWNNNGYQEIADFMDKHRVPKLGVSPSAPDFVAIARAYGMAAKSATYESFPDIFKEMAALHAPALIDLKVS